MSAETAIGSGKLDTKILFVNGIDGDPKTNVDKLSKLVDVLIKNGVTFPGERVEVGMFENPGDGFFDDKIELLLQAQLSGEAFGVAKLNSPSATREQALYQGLLGKAYAEQILNGAADAETARHVYSFSSNLRDEILRLVTSDGVNVIVVSHSQGNYFAEAAHALLRYTATPQQWKIIEAKLRFVGVAPTAASTPNGRYLSAREDVALDTHTAQTVAVNDFRLLPRNVKFCTDEELDNLFVSIRISCQTSDKDGVDPLNHGFVETYTSSWTDKNSARTVESILASLVRDSYGELTKVTNPPAAGECSFAFSDTFDGTGPVGTDWRPANSNVNGTLVRQDGKLTVTTTDGNAGIYRNMDTSYTGNISVRITEKNGAGGALRSYGTWLLFQQNTTRDRGYGVVLRRTDATVPDSSVELVLNGVVLERVRTPFEFGARIDVRVSAAPDGRVRGIVTNDDGRQYTFSFAARTLPAGGSDLLIDQELPSGNSPSITYPTIDDFAFSYGDGCLDGNFVYAQSFVTDPRWTTDQPDNFKWNIAGGTYLSRTFSGVPTYSPNRYSTIQLPAFDPNRGFILEWDQKLLAASGNAQVHFGLYSSDLLADGVTYVGVPPLIPQSTVNFSLGSAAALGSIPTYRLNIYGASGGDLGQGGSGGSSVAEFGGWYRVRLSYSPTAGEVALTVTDKVSNAVRLSLTRPVVGANVFSSGMRYLGIANHPTGYHPNLIWALTPSGYLESEFDNVVLTYEAPQTFFPTISATPVAVPIGGSTTVTWSTGAAPLAICSMTRGSTLLSPLTAATGSFTASDIQGRTTFTLTCGASSATATVEIIPVVGGG